jgi:hypothetical protein
MKQIVQVLQIHIVQNPALLDIRLTRIESQIRRRIELSLDVIQQAQHRRLSVRLLDQDSITRLFNRLNVIANSHGCKLLLEHQSDLFQVETSYFFDGADVHLLLHVPMVTPDSLLILFKLHPFPVPLESKHILMPTVGNDILAITAGSQRYSTQLSSSDLIGCHVINKVYLCESQGVLRKHFNDTCLGALYQQNLESVRKLCTLQVLDATEIVRQLLGNWFAVYSPKQTTIPVECRNGTSKELMIPKGISKFHLSAGCTAQFETHLVLRVFSIREPADFLEYDWKWDPISLSDDNLFSPKELLPVLATLSKYGIHNPTLDEIQEIRIQGSHSPGWWAHFIHFLGNTTLAILILTGLVIGGIRFRRHWIAKHNFLAPTGEHHEDVELRNQLYPNANANPNPVYNPRF